MQSFSVPSMRVTHCHREQCWIVNLTRTEQADGTWTTWSGWSKCSLTCSNGIYTRDRQCIFLPDRPHGHNCTGMSHEIQTCNEGLCPVDGVWSFWGAWQTCSLTCGNGTQSRKRKCDFTPHQPHGHNCTGEDTQHQSCNTNFCPVDGLWQEWSNWTACSQTCRNGTQLRDRICYFPSGIPHGNNCSGAARQIQTCNPNHCPVNGSWAEWSPWSGCIVTCGNGTEHRARKCQYDPRAPRGEPCHGQYSDSKDCFQVLCPKDGILSSWSEWTGCSLTCGNGTRSRSRSCNFEPGYAHGKDCEEPRNSTDPCNMQPCSVDGHWDAWSSWSTCSHTCGVAVQHRQRVCIFPEPTAKGTVCPGNFQETQDCAMKLCPVTCATCGDNPPDMCELLYEQNTGCPDPYCINILKNPDSGQRLVERKCGSLQECRVDWIQQTSQLETCTLFNENFIYTQSFECTYCCITANCNSNIHPENSTLYWGN